MTAETRKAERFVVVSAEDATKLGWCEAASSKVGDRDSGWLLYDTAAAPPRLVGWDGGEPEDQLLVRNWDWVAVELNRLAAEVGGVSAPLPMLLWCPECGARHLDVGDFATKPHHTHACQHCGHVWRPAIGPTVGVQFLPGFKNEASR